MLVRTAGWSDAPGTSESHVRLLQAESANGSTVFVTALTGREDVSLSERDAAQSDRTEQSGEGSSRKGRPAKTRTTDTKHELAWQMACEDSDAILPHGLDDDVRPFAAENPKNG